MGWWRKLARPGQDPQASSNKRATRWGGGELWRPPLAVITSRSRQFRPNKLEARATPASWCWCYSSFRDFSAQVAVRSFEFEVLVYSVHTNERSAISCPFNSDTWAPCLLAHAGKMLRKQHHQLPLLRWPLHVAPQISRICARAETTECARAWMKLAEVVYCVYCPITVKFYIQTSPRLLQNSQEMVVTQYKTAESG